MDSMRSISRILSTPRSDTTVLDALRGRHILVTGATGFLGKLWLSMILDRVPTIGRVSILVRPSRDEPAAARYARIIETSPAFRSLRARLGNGLGQFLASKLDVVEGDLRQPMAGLDAPTLDALASSLDGVVHFAALTDFEPDPLEALAVNVRGAESIASLCVRSGAPLLHVSTCFVAGNVSGDIDESVMPTTPSNARIDAEEEARALEGSFVGAAAERTDAGRRARIAIARERARTLGWPNIYTYTKSIGERLIVATRDLVYTIVRPSIVEGSLRYPFPGWNEGINSVGPIVWLASGLSREIPYSPHHHIDVVPVDLVARGVTTTLAALLRGRLGGDVVHLASSSNAITAGRTVELISLAARKHHGRRDASPVEQLVHRHLPEVFPAAGGKSSLRFLRKSVGTLSRVLGGVDREKVRRLLGTHADRIAGDHVADGAEAASHALSRTARTIRSAERVFELYRPFIHDNDYVFRTERIASIDAALSDEDRASFGFDVQAIDWRRFWIDVEYPGLQKWCFPVLRGEQPPEDMRAPGPRLGLVSVKTSPEEGRRWMSV